MSGEIQIDYLDMIILDDKVINKCKPLSKLGEGVSGADRCKMWRGDERMVSMVGLCYRKDIGFDFRSYREVMNIS